MGLKKQARLQREREVMRAARKSVHGAPKGKTIEAAEDRYGNPVDPATLKGKTPLRIGEKPGTGLRGEIAARAKAGKDLVRGNEIGPEGRKTVRARAREAVSDNKGYDLAQVALSKGQLAPDSEGWRQAAIQQAAVKAKGYDVVAGKPSAEEKARLKAARKFGKRAIRYISAGTK